MRKFCFTDSSGILKKDQFFGVGLLVVKNVGDMGDKLNKNRQPAESKVINSKNRMIERLISENKEDEVIKILKKSNHFEMKFDNIRPSTIDYYEKMVDIFLSDSENRFSTMIINKHNPSFNGAGAEDAWEAYTKYVANLMVKEMKNLPPDDELCLVVDEITKPKNKPLSLEDTLLSKIRDEVAKEPSLDFNKIFGAFSIESHSNLLMQLCDVLLGAVIYDYKKSNNLVSMKTARKKEAFVNKIRIILGVPTLAQDFTKNSKAYFHVFEDI